MMTRKRGLETRGLLMGFIIAAHKGRQPRLCIPRYSLVTSQAKSFATETRHPQSAPCAAFYRGCLQLSSSLQMPCRTDWCSGPNDVIYSPKPTRPQAITPPFIPTLDNSSARIYYCASPHGGQPP